MKTSISRVKLPQITGRTLPVMLYKPGEFSHFLSSFLVEKKKKKSSVARPKAGSVFKAGGYQECQGQNVLTVGPGGGKLKRQQERRKKITGKTSPDATSPGACRAGGHVQEALSPWATEPHLPPSQWLLHKTSTYLKMPRAGCPLTQSLICN